MDHVLLCLTALCLYLKPALLQTVTELYLGTSKCSMKTYEVNENQFYLIVWEGRQLPNNCKIGFLGRNKNDIFDQYKVCAEVLEYTVDQTKCPFQMVYYEQKQFSKHITRTFNCMSTPEIYCSKPDRDFDIAFSSNEESASTVRILIKAIKTYDYKATIVGAIVGGVLTILVILTVIIVVLVFIRVKRRRKPVLIPDPDRETRV